MESIWIIRHWYGHPCTCSVCTGDATNKEKHTVAHNDVDDDSKIEGKAMSIDDHVEDGNRKRQFIQRPDIDPDADTVQLYRWNCSGYDLPGFGSQPVHAYFKTQQNPEPDKSVSCDGCAWSMVQYLQNLESRSQLRDKEGSSE